MCRSRPLRKARCWSRRSRSASAAPIARSSRASTARRRRRSERLILGHESLGRVVEAHDGFAKGDHVVGIVRHPDPVPCPACASGQWDMCRNGLYTEHGIKGLNGFGAERWRIAPEFAVKVDPALGILGVLLEPTSVVAKAWDHIDRVWRLDAPPHRALITGAGPIGLLAALIGVQRGCDVHVYDRNENGPKPALVKELGGTYHSGDLDDAHEACARRRDRVHRRAAGHRGAALPCLARQRDLPRRRRPARIARSSTWASSTAPWCSTTAPCSAP